MFNLARVGDLPRGYLPPAMSPAARSDAAAPSAWTASLASALRTNPNGIGREERAAYLSSFTGSTAVNARLLDATAPESSRDARLVAARQWALEAVGPARAGTEAGPLAAALEGSFQRHLGAFERVPVSPNPVVLEWRPAPTGSGTTIPCAMGLTAARGGARPTGAGCTPRWDIASFNHNRCDAVQALGLNILEETQPGFRAGPAGREAGPFPAGGAPRYPGSS